MKIKSLDHVAIHVKDVVKSSEFYEQVLELPRLPRPNFGFPGAWFRLGSHQELHLIGGREQPVHAHNRGNHFALAVDSIEAAEAFIKTKNYPYRPPRQRPDGVWQMYLSDPDGHVIELTEL